jgi:DNA invertase Pin-like site-specific DNA recombinase
MKKVVGYIRVSTDTQAESGLGLADQEMKIRGYSQIYDLELVEIIVDAGASAKSLNRDGIQRVIEMSTSGDIDGIVIAKLDRLTRKMTDLHQLLDSVFSKVELHSVAEKVDTSSAAGRLVLNVLMSVAEWEREAIGERTSAALQTKKKIAKRKINGRAPLGWQWVDGELVKHEGEYKVIERMRKLRDLGVTYREIAKFLNDEGYKTKKNGQWAGATIHTALKAQPA